MFKLLILGLSTLSLMSQAVWAEDVLEERNVGMELARDLANRPFKQQLMELFNNMSY